MKLRKELGVVGPGQLNRIFFRITSTAEAHAGRSTVTSNCNSTMGQWKDKKKKVEKRKKIENRKRKLLSGFRWTGRCGRTSYGLVVATRRRQANDRADPSLSFLSCALFAAESGMRHV